MTVMIEPIDKWDVNTEKIFSINTNQCMLFTVDLWLKNLCISACATGN